MSRRSSCRARARGRCPSARPPDRSCAKRRSRPRVPTSTSSRVPPSRAPATSAHSRPRSTRPIGDVVADRATRGTRRVESMWGTATRVDVRDAVAPEVLDELFGWFSRVDDLFSTWREDSQISRLGRGELRRHDVADEVREVLDLCDAVTYRSQGAFDCRFAADPRVQQRPGFAPIDPSGLVKGWALERGAAVLLASGVANLSINAGGDLLTRGRPRPRRAWRVGIQHPVERRAVAAVVEGADLAVATLGRYERGDHVIDPRRGAPATDLLSVTVIGSDLALTDAYATAGLVLGPAGMDWLASLPDSQALAITNDHTVIRTGDFPLISGRRQQAGLEAPLHRRITERVSLVADLGRPC